MGIKKLTIAYFQFSHLAERLIAKITHGVPAF